jgi:hypothetical protein
MPSSAQTDSLLPQALPTNMDARVQLIALRRMAAHGLRDARASMLMLHQFGLDYRRRLVLLRAFVHELAQASRRTIQLAPCCAVRMTADEALLLRALGSAADDPADAADALLDLTKGGAVCHPLSLAAMLGR